MIFTRGSGEEVHHHGRLVPGKREIVGREMRRVRFVDGGCGVHAVQ